MPRHEGQWVAIVPQLLLPFSPLSRVTTPHDADTIFFPRTPTCSLQIERFPVLAGLGGETLVTNDGGGGHLCGSSAGSFSTESPTQSRLSFALRDPAQAACMYDCACICRAGPSDWPHGGFLRAHTEASGRCQRGVLRPGGWQPHPGRVAQLLPRCESWEALSPTFMPLASVEHRVSLSAKQGGSYRRPLFPVCHAMRTHTTTHNTTFADVRFIAYCPP